MNTLFASNVVASLRDMATTPNIINTPIDPSLVLELSAHIANIAAAVHQGDPLISRNLSLANGSLFGANAYGQTFVNPIALGQIIFAIDYIIGKQEDNSNPQGEDSAWSCIHPAIVKSSKRLYDDGHYADAAVDAFIEFNRRAKKLYKEARPDATVIPGGRDLRTSSSHPRAPFQASATQSDRLPMHGSPTHALEATVTSDFVRTSESCAHESLTFARAPQLFDTWLPGG